MCRREFCIGSCRSFREQVLPISAGQTCHQSQTTTPLPHNEPGVTDMTPEYKAAKEASVTNLGGGGIW